MSERVKIPARGRSLAEESCNLGPRGEFGGGDTADRGPQTGLGVLWKQGRRIAQP